MEISYFSAMNKFSQALGYLRYLFTSDTRYDIHSPFIFNLVNEVINKDKNEDEFIPIEKLRKEMLSSKKEIHITDMGAGSKVSEGAERKLKQIARYSLKSPKYARLLYRLLKYFKPANIIELGTCLGLTSIYFSRAAPSAQITTIEGSEEIAQIAADNFKNMDCQNIDLIKGNFDNVLLQHLEKIQKADFIFFDGNHRKEPTLRYFKQALSYIHANTIFIFDDIHWSEEMSDAWKEIKSHPKVKVTIDLYFIGIVLFREELQKQDFIIRF
jgi:predicted O-methyltransferase YrrM